MDIRFKNDSSILVAGSSGSGKSTFITSLLRNADTMFEYPPNKIYWYSSFPTPREQHIENVIYRIGITKDFMSNLQRHDIIIFDDLMSESANNREITELFTRGTHHIGCCLIYITQNIFDTTNKQNRTRNLNSNYIIFFRNIRDATQITSLSHQMFPDNSKFLTAAFHDITTSKPYSYMVIDLRQESSDIIRVRSNILPQEHPVKIYIPTNRFNDEIYKHMKVQKLL